MRRRGIFLLSAYFFIGASASAQQYPFVHYTPKDGLVNNRARFMFQDSKGKLYISTFGGLSVYDGSRFTNYTTDNGLVVNLVNAIVEMGDDSLWIIPNANRLHCMVNGMLKDLKTQDDFYPVINQLIKCSDGFYYALADEGFFRFEKNRFVKIPLSGLPDPDAARYLGMAVEMDGKIFILYDKSSETTSSGALLIYDLYAKKIIAYQNTIYCLYITRVTQDELWVSTNNGVLRVDKKGIAEGKIHFSGLPEPYQIPKNILPNVIYVDRQKNVWFAIKNGLLKANPEGKNIFYTEEGGLPNNIQTSIFQDRENNMWFTNEQNGFAKLPGIELEFFQELRPGFTPTDIYIPPGTDSVWFYDGYHNKSLLLTGSGITQEYFFTGPRSQWSKIITTPKKYILIGSDIYIWDPIPQKSRYNLSLLYRDPANINSYTSATTDKLGNLVASSDKITVIVGNKVLIAPLNYYADQVVVDKKNRIWVAARSGKLFCFGINISQNDTSLQLLESSFENLPQISPRSITADNDGNVWIGTRDHGLYCLFFDSLSLKSWKRITTRNGLSENFVDYLHCDADNTIWACTPAGLDKVRLKDGRFFIENITASNNIYQAIMKIQVTHLGVHWVLTQKGAIKINPQNFYPNTVQGELLFTQVTAGNEQKVFSKNKLSLSWRQNNLSFHIAAPSFVDEKQTRFSYFLEGSGNTNWSEPSSNTEINFVNLPSGKYTLKAKAIFLNGLYPDSESSLSFVITPPWWQTWWFRSIAGLLIIGLLIISIRFYYRRKLEKQKVVLEKQQAIDTERTRIATDIHDDLGAGLTRIKFITENLEEMTNDVALQPEMKKLKSSSIELVEKMAEIIWAMSEKNNSLEDMIFYLRSYAVDYCNENRLRCEFIISENIPQKNIGGQVRRNVFLVLKESLHNIVKHAGAKTVVIDMKVDNKLLLTITDDGKGFEHKHHSGNGLLNMQMRAEALNGKISVSNTIGTTIQLEIPL